MTNQALTVFCAMAALSAITPAKGGETKLSHAALTALVAKCAPSVAQDTMMSLIVHESGANPFAIGVNGEKPHTLHPANIKAAQAAAAALTAAGESYDVGLGQINSANFAALGITPENAFEPCKNVSAAAAVLRQAYARLRPRAATNQQALDAALSTYNTGNSQSGLANGYVRAVRGALVPSLRSQAQPQPAPAWDVYGHARAASSSPTKQDSRKAIKVMVFGAKQ